MRRSFPDPNCAFIALLGLVLRPSILVLLPILQTGVGALHAAAVCELTAPDVASSLTFADADGDIDAGDDLPACGLPAAESRVPSGSTASLALPRGPAATSAGPREQLARAPPAA